MLSSQRKAGLIRLFICLIVFCSAVIDNAGQTNAADVTWFPGVGDVTSSSANGISSDGSTVVGSAVSNEVSTPEAFIWTSSGLRYLGLLTGGSVSTAYGVSGNGSVVVGSADISSGAMHAFRWTQPGGMVDLGTLGGTNSIASGANADGSVVVGWASNGSYARAFRWTQSGGMVDLGTLGGNVSIASGVNADGSVVVGWAFNSSNYYHAFRYTQATSMADLGTLGGNNSEAIAVNADGSVVVGWSATNSLGYNHAFRWTQSGGMQDLGTLPGGSGSLAYAVSADGLVVVGSASDPTLPSCGQCEAMRAFRWTQATGMLSVENWIIANGGSPLASGNFLDSASGVSADGNIVVGTGRLNGSWQAYIARVSGGGSTNPGATPDPTPGVLGLSDFQNSLKQPVLSGNTLHERLRNGVMIDLQNNAPRKGQFAFSSQAVYEKFTHSQAEGDGLSGVFKLIYGITDSFRAGLSYIRGGEHFDLGDNGNLKNEVDIFGGLLSYGDYRGDGLRGRVSFAYGTGDADLTRKYLTGSGEDESSGKFDVHQYGFVAEVGYGFRVMPKTLITPLVSYEWVRTKLDAYTESGGSFPASFDARTLKDRFVKAGMKVKQDLSTVVELTGEADYVRRISSTRTPVTGELVGVGVAGAFSQNVDFTRDWAELKAGVGYTPEWLMKNRNLKLTLDYQVDLGQRFDVPTHRIDAGFVLFF